MSMEAPASRLECRHGPSTSSCRPDCAGMTATAFLNRGYVGVAGQALKQEALQQVSGDTQPAT